MTNIYRALYWLARMPSIFLQVGWEPKWRWANPKGQDGPVSSPGMNPDLPLPTQQGSDT